MTTSRQTELRYNPQEIDRKWQGKWDRDALYRVNDDDPRPKWYELTMYPYPSGNLHIGHWYAMAPADAHARFRRMQGYNVLHPMGFDAFGLPAENAAIQRGIHPLTWTTGNIENMRRQLRSIGATYDWDREIICCLPEYYRWNQWMFLKLYETGLAYRAQAPVNWCPSCQTVLANEQVKDGKCERCETLVTRRNLAQWFLRITKYADELLDFSNLEWPDRILNMQRHWIGRSEGVEVAFDISEYSLAEPEIKTFTTRVDTIHGVTFIVMAPENPLVTQLTTTDHLNEVEVYQEQARRQTDIERLSNDKEQTGTFTGAYAVNRLNGQRVPIFIADYVLLTYGTGIVMGVPAHDERDFAFAKRYKIPVKVVISPPDWDGEDLSEAYTGQGLQVNSGKFNGLSNVQGMQSIADYIEEQGWGKRTTSYRIRDWLISRQRYWGTPIPIVYCKHCGEVPIPENQLPVLLPEDADFQPTGESPLARNAKFVDVNCPKCKRSAKRETDTMDTFVDSSWYFLRYTSPKEENHAFNPSSVSQWGPVDQYTGGAEHAVMHLLYARFFTKALRDLGLVTFDEPFLRLFNQGTIIAERHKMSKSRGNVVTPDSYVGEVGADVIRLYLMFLGPWEYGGEWSDAGMNGIARWVNRIWDLCHNDANALNSTSNSNKSTTTIQRTLHKTIRKVVTDLERFQFNTAIAALMELTNTMAQIWERGDIDSSTWDSTIENLLLLLAPFAPHISEELWEKTKRPYSIHNQLLPQWNAELAADSEFTLVIQVNGKVRDRIQVPSDISEEKVKEIALSSRNVQKFLQSSRVIQEIYVPGRLVNLVVRLN